MIAQKDLEQALARAMKTGADFAEIFCQDSMRHSLGMIDCALESAVSAQERGVGIRILCGTRCIYAYGNDLSLSGLLHLADSVAAALDGPCLKQQDILLTPMKLSSVHPILKNGSDFDYRKKAEAIRAAHDSARAYSSKIVQVSVSLADSMHEVLIANSEGLLVQDQRAYTRLRISAVASNGTENQSGSESPGAHMGLEFLDTINAEALGRASAKQAVTMLHAPLCPAGTMPVVMENGFGGVIFHEACGHSLEATSVARGNSVFCGKLGEKIASEKVSAFDDGTIPNAWGSLNISDEGEKTQRIQLLDRGILKSYMIDRLGSRRMNLPSTGSGRRQGYTYAPTSRMTNTYIAAGEDDNEEMISSVEYGLYAKSMGGGSVNPVTCEFNFAVREGYLIENGRITAPVRGATLIGKGHEVLLNIDRVGRNMCMAQGMCGSESGSIPTNVGQPRIRISSITVGGKAE